MKAQIMHISGAISIIITVCTLAFTINQPVIAAIPAKYADCTTNAERVQYFKDTYGFTEVSDKGADVVNGVAASRPDRTKKTMDAAQKAFSILGEATTRKIFSCYTDKMEFEIVHPNAYGWGGQFGSERTTSSYAGTTYLAGTIYIKETTPAHGIIHETMHAFDEGLLYCGTLYDNDLRPFTGTIIVAKINGGYKGFTNSNQYITGYASRGAQEDFAETCADMILRGDGSPCTLGKDTILYKKYAACYELLLEHFGAKSNAVKRSAAFLSIDLPKE